ncbi:MAG: FAD binding domain-containing protein [Elusimicrobiota bacterium]
MRGDPKSIRWLRARTPEQALALYAQNPGALPLAGGSDLMVAFNAGHLNRKTVLDLSGVERWRKISAGRTLAIGSLATFTEIQNHPQVAKRAPLLALALSEVGGPAVQNRATLGGNIANASPAGDSFPPLAVYEARVHLMSVDSQRAIPVLEAFAGVKKNSLKPGELIGCVELPALPSKPSRSLFRKLGTRSAQAVSKLAVAGLLWLGKDRRVVELRFAVNAMAPTARRLKSAEMFLRGKTLDAPAIERACELVSQDVSPIDDFRSSAAYRLSACRNLLRAFLS